MSWSVTDIAEQNGRNVLITGANGGLGLETARALAGKGAHVIMASRNQQKAATAEAEIHRDHPRASLEVRELDLASLSSIERFSKGILADFDRIDLLINNAGVMGIPPRKTVDGFEMQFGVNHLGHYALTAQVLSLLVNTKGSRVVAVTSTARHYGKPVNPENPHLEDEYEPWRAYGQSKLANLHFAIGLERGFREAGAMTESLVAHPGLTNTDLQSNSVRETEGGASQRFWEFLAQRTGMSPARGALTLLRAATDPRASGGQLYTPRYVNAGPPVRRPLIGRSLDTNAIEVLFDVSARETGITLDAAKALEEAKK